MYGNGKLEVGSNCVCWPWLKGTHKAFLQGYKHKYFVSNLNIVVKWVRKTCEITSQMFVSNLSYITYFTMCFHKLEMIGAISDLSQKHSRQWNKQTIRPRSQLSQGIIFPLFEWSQDNYLSLSFCSWKKWPWTWLVR